SIDRDTTKRRRRSDAPTCQEVPRVVELLDTAITATTVEDEDVPVLVRSHAHEQSELSVPAAGKPRLAGIGARLEGSQPVPHPPAERQEEVPSVRELLDAVVIIGDKDVPRSVDGDSGGAVELPVPTTRNTRLARSGARLEGRASIPHSPAK